MSERVLEFPGGPNPPPPTSLLADPRFHRALLLVGAALLILTRLGETTLSSYDDTYYAEKAKEIVLTGEWLVPPWGYEPQFDNGPLYLWGTAVLFRLFGVSELTARLLSALAGVGCVWVTWRIGSRLFGPWVGFLSGAALMTTLYFLKYSRHGMLDTLQTLLVAGGVALLLLGLERDRTLPTDLAGGTLVGLAVLNKSLLGYLAWAIYAAVVVAARSPRARALRPGIVAALSASVLIPGAWFAAATWRYGMSFLERHFGYILWHRAVHGDPGQVVTPASYAGYLTGLAANFLPWLPLAIWGAWCLLRGDEGRRRAAVPLAWAAVVILLLSLSAAKKSWYLLPAYPALAILAGCGLDDVLSRWPRGRERFVAALTLTILVLHGVVVTTGLPLGRDRNRDIKEIAPAAKAAVPEGEHVISFGLEPHWSYVSALYVYADRPLSLPITDEAVMERVLRNAEARAILTDLPTYRTLASRLDRAPRVLAASGDLILLAPPEEAPGTSTVAPGGRSPAVDKARDRGVAAAQRAHEGHGPPARWSAGVRSGRASTSASGDA